MAKRLTKLKAKFSRLGALNSMVDARDETSMDARRVKRQLNDKWTQRRGGSVRGFFKAQAPAPCYEVAA